MRCVTPMYRRYEKGDHNKGIIVSRAEAMHELEMDEHNERFKLFTFNEKSPKYAYEQIPCKKCWACQLNYSAEWATRIDLEARKYEHNYFVTLTYDDLHVPVLSKIEYEEKYKLHGEVIETKEITLENDGTWKYSLVYDDIKRFIHSLRKYLKDTYNHTGLKYFYAGEYGSETQRPHFHIILLNCPLNINEFHSFHVDGKFFKAHWKSRELEAIWTEPCEGNIKWKDRTPLGIIDVAEVEWSCIAYVARYCTKKLDFSQDKRVYLNEGRLPEKVGMSKGIGFDYFRQHKDEIYKNDEIIMKTVKGNTGSYKPPKAFDRKLKEMDPKAYELIRASRQKAGERTKKLEKSITDMTDLQMLRIKAENVAKKMSMLPRVGEW